MSSPRTVYRAFSLIFRVPAIREQFNQVQELIRVCYLAAIALRALQVLISSDPRLSALLMLIGAGISIGTILWGMKPQTTPTEHEEHRTWGPWRRGG